MCQRERSWPLICYHQSNLKSQSRFTTMITMNSELFNRCRPTGSSHFYWYTIPVPIGANAAWMLGNWQTLEEFLEVNILNTPVDFVMSALWFWNDLQGIRISHIQRIFQAWQNTWLWRLNAASIKPTHTLSLAPAPVAPIFPFAPSFSLCYLLSAHTHSRTHTH